MRELKVETVEDFLERGGLIKKIPCQPFYDKKVTSRNTVDSVAVILSYDEADLFYGKSKAATKLKKGPTIDISSLPEALRIKYLDKLNQGTLNEKE